MSKTKHSENAVYPERVNYGIPRGTVERLRKVAKHRQRLPGEVLRDILREALDKAERAIEREEAEAQEARRNAPDHSQA